MKIKFNNTKNKKEIKPRVSRVSVRTRQPGRTGLRGSHNALEARREQLTQCNETIDENSMFLNNVGGKQRNVVYGLGSLASEYYGTSSASTSTTSPSPQ